jgi:predicted Zn-dependent protease
MGGAFRRWEVARNSGSAVRVKAWLSGAQMFVAIVSVCHLAVVASSAKVARPTGVVVVPVGDVPIEVVQRVSQSYGTRWSIPIDVRVPVPLDRTLVDPQRRQVVAERALLWLERGYAQNAPGRIIVGVLADDLYSAERSWRFAFSIRKRRPGAPGLAVMSTARMKEEFYGHNPNEALLADRFGKMLAKNLGVLFLGVPLNDDPNSVMYRSVLSVDDLDRVTVGPDGRPLAR